jgi:hypothetical protein
MDEIEHWLEAREASFFSRLGCDFLDEFEQVGLESDAFDGWFQYRYPEDVIEQAHRREFLDSVNEVAEAQWERVRAISAQKAEVEEAVCRRELSACARTLERCTPRLEAAGLVENWSAWNAKLVRVSANIIAFSRLEERVGIPEEERTFQWLGWTIERGHVICGVERIGERIVSWSVW